VSEREERIRLITACDTQLRSGAGGSAAESENRELRIMLAIAHAGLSLYTDDGELQDNRVAPFIDFKRDPVAEIERKLRERAYSQELRALPECGCDLQGRP
jgi:hypothetical protein